MEALKQPTIRVVAVIAEGVPEGDTKKLIAYARANNKILIGPATVGGVQVCRGPAHEPYAGGPKLPEKGTTYCRPQDRVNAGIFRRPTPQSSPCQALSCCLCRCAYQAPGICQQASLSAVIKCCHNSITRCLSFTEEAGLFSAAHRQEHSG